MRGNRKKIVKKILEKTYIMKGIYFTRKIVKIFPKKTYIMDTIKFHVGKMMKFYMYLLKNVLIYEGENIELPLFIKICRY